MTLVNLPTPVIYLVWTLESSGFEVFLVGGAVRDLLVKKELITDWDITTNATPDEILKLFKDSFYDNHFGTVMIAPKHVAEQLGRENAWDKLDVFDITTYRSESGYSDRRRPDKVEWGKTIEEDLKRRDFTINAIAMKLGNLNKVVRKDSWKKSNQLEIEGLIIDPYQGQEDLDDKVIRAVGEANTRFDEDALRMMRAVRFGAQMGLTIEESTLEAMKQKSNLIKYISWERIRDELLKIIASDFAADGIILMNAIGLLDYILPELQEGRGVKQGGHHIHDVWTHSVESLRNCPSKDAVVRLATLLHDIGKPRTMKKQGPRGVTFYGHEVVGAKMGLEIAERLRLSKKQKKKLFLLMRWHMFTYQPEMTDAAIRRFIRRVGVENINDMMMLRIGDRKGGGSNATSWRLRELQKRVGENLYTPMSTRDLKINGHDLMKKYDFKPSPILGRILNRLFEEVMEGNLENSKKELLQRADDMLEQERKDESKLE